MPRTSRGGIILATKFYSPSEIAELLAVSVDKPLTWIRSGELKAFNAATKRAGKPRWRISGEAFAEFQAARAAVATAVQPIKRQSRRSQATKPRQWIS